MSVMRYDKIHILILNYNGLRWLEECLPSIVLAARHSPRPCRITVIDNDSEDESVPYLKSQWPEIAVIQEKNRGLATFNVILQNTSEPAVLLLNNDIKLDKSAIAPLLDALEKHEDALFTAPLCWTFDDLEYEGMRTRVRFRRGMIQGMSRVPGHVGQIARSDLTAAAGPVLAVDRRKFLAIGGYPPLYFPGRIEDLDLGFLGWMMGWKGYYVPESVAYHKGFGSFGPSFGASGCDRLAIRNTLLFTWKNIAGFRLLQHACWLLVRSIHAILTFRLGFLSALASAVARFREAHRTRRHLRVGRHGWIKRQEEFFLQYHW